MSKHKQGECSVSLTLEQRGDWFYLRNERGGLAGSILRVTGGYVAGYDMSDLRPVPHYSQFPRLAEAVAWVRDLRGEGM